MTTPRELDALTGSGEMGELARTIDWSATSLGPMESWPQSLKSAFGILMTSRFSMWMGWGPDLAFLYNDGYRRDTIGKKHPWAFGQPAHVVWAEIWDDVKPRIETVLQTGMATWDEALLLFLERNGYPEETYHTFSYSPLIDADGTRQGIFCVVMEETERVIGSRRLATLRELATELAPISRRDDVVAAVERQMCNNLLDLPFSLLYIFDETGTRARLHSRAGIAADHAAAPALIDTTTTDALWQAAELMTNGGTQLRVALDSRFGDMPTGGWNRAPVEAVVIPVGQTSQDRFVGFMVAGLNPYRLYDDAYAGFIHLIAGQIGGSLASARAYEEELVRAEVLNALRNDADRARRDAEAAGARLQEVFMKAPAIIAIVRGPEHVFESANPLYLDLIGHRDVMGRTVADALPEVVGQGFLDLLDTVYRTGQPFIANEMHVLLQRTERGAPEDVFLNFVYQPLFESDGSTSGILIHAVDVTESVQTRQTIEQQAQELREHSIEAEAARAEAEDANLAKSRFLAIMSHELRTPLNAILGYSDLLDAEIAGPVTDGQRRQLDRIIVAARHLLRLIDEILTFSRIEAGREELRLEPVDVTALVVETASLIEPLARAKSLEFTCRTPGDLEAVTDTGKIRQILLNLLSNATKFTDAGGVSLVVEADDSWMVFEVRDTGIGIPENEQARVFEAFSQVHQTPTRTAGGTGLGLSVTQELVRLMGGTVVLESEPGRGSCFEVKLPRYPSSAPSAGGQ